MFFFFNDTATTEIYTLSLHDALPIWLGGEGRIGLPHGRPGFGTQRVADAALLACGDDILMLAADPDVANERRLLPEVGVAPMIVGERAVEPQPREQVVDDAVAHMGIEILQHPDPLEPARLQIDR